MRRFFLHFFVVGYFMMLGAENNAVRAGTHQGFDAKEKEAIEQIVRDYLLSNPELLIEVGKVLEARRRSVKAEQSRRVLVARRDELLTDPDSPIAGNPDGDVTIVEFFDYQCPYCKAVSPRVARLMAEDKNVRLVYKEWPILGPVSVVAARAALAAQKQGKYEEIHERFMNAKGKLSEAGIFKAAADLDLDVDKLKRDMESPEIKEMLQRNHALASALGISGTPAFVIGDELIKGAIRLPDFKRLVRLARRDGYQKR